MDLASGLCWAVMACCTTVNDVSLRLQMGVSGTCSGTAVARDVILTAEHCITEMPVSFINDQPVVTIETERDGADHVLIRVGGVEFSKWAKLGPPLKQGDDIKWVGNPAGEPDMYRKGYVVRATSEVIHIDAPGFAGDSGSGFFNKRDRLVGVLSGAERWWNYEGFDFQLITAYPLAFTPEQIEKMTR
jgi:V8-like Glu-specific endopeptidase